MRLLLEKWEQYVSEGTLVGRGMGKKLALQLEDTTKLVELFDPDSEANPLPEEVRTEIILHFENLQDVIQKFYPQQEKYETTT